MHNIMARPTLARRLIRISVIAALWLLLPPLVAAAATLPVMLWAWTTPPNITPDTPASYFDATFFNTYLRDNLNYLYDRLEPVGIMKDWPAAVPPSGWLICNGQAVSRTTYADLYQWAVDNDLVGTDPDQPFGPGDGTTTFTLPDFRGRSAIGADDDHALGTAGGSDTVTLTEANLAPHAHDQTDHSHEVYYTSGLFASGANTFPVLNLSPGGFSLETTDGSGVTETTGDGEPFSVRNPYVAVHKIIRT